MNVVDRDGDQCKSRKQEAFTKCLFNWNCGLYILFTYLFMVIFGMDFINADGIKLKRQKLNEC